MTLSQRFPSSVSIVVVAPLLLVLLALISSQSRGFQPVPLLVLGVASVFVGWVLLTTDYTLSSNELLVRSGPTRRRVPTALVRRVRPTRSLLSAPALSFDRIEISGDFGAVMISPRDRAGFLVALRAAAPQARFEGLGVESREQRRD
ncbi:MAG: PH domain-containing protein [Acidobacteria bacterium]|nr:PH domain-containing protein [Acidobacteriota bacterium]